MIRTTRGRAIVEVLRAVLDQLVEHAKTEPGEAELINSMIVADLRARRPVAIASLSVLPPPGEVIRDPRQRG